MSQLTERLSQLFRRKKRGEEKRGFLIDDRFASTLTEIARTQKRDQKELYESVLRAGIDELLRHDQYQASWEALSPANKKSRRLSVWAIAAAKLPTS